MPAGDGGASAARPWVDGASRPWAWERTARVYADRATVFNLLAEAELWPAIFPHVRSVRVLRRDGARRLIAVRASWHGVPIRWRAVQTVDAERGRMTLQQVSPLTRGSAASWTVTLADRGDSATEVRVCAQPVLHLPGFVGPLAARLVGRRVARDLAQAMLARLKEIAEGGSLAGPR